MASKNATFCTNPATGRSIRIGGRMWRKMVKQGVIDADTYDNRNVLYTVQEDEYETEEDLKNEVYRQKKRLVSENKDKYRKPVIYKNYVINGTSRLTNEETARQTANAAINVIDDIQNNEEGIPTNMSRDEAHQYLQGLIFNKMISQKKKFKNTRLEPRQKKPQNLNERFENLEMSKKKYKKPIPSQLRKVSRQQLKP